MDEQNNNHNKSGSLQQIYKEISHAFYVHSTEFSYYKDTAIIPSVRFALVVFKEVNR